MKIIRTFKIDVKSEEDSNSTTLAYAGSSNVDPGSAGFGSSITQTGEDAFGTAVGNAGTWELFDKFITDNQGNTVIDPGSFIIDGNMWDSLSDGGASPANGLFFNGPNARAANGGNPVGLYTPSAWDDGSSVSHLDDDNQALANLMMLAATDAGPSARDLSAIEVGVLRDLGYNVVPLPPAIVLLAPALLGLGIIRRRRNSKVNVE